MEQQYEYVDSIISVITPTYNSEQFIEETIKSVQAQTIENWEMVIVDDCSTDRTVEIIESIRQHDSRIKLHKLDENKGAGYARNVAMDLAQGRFIAFLDSDDLWLPEKLEKQYRNMKIRDIAFSHTQYKVIDEDGHLTGAPYEIPNELKYGDLLKFCHIGCLTVMLDRKKVGHVQMDLMRNRQDYLLWLDITKEGFKAYALQEVLSKYRKVSNSISSNKLKVAKLNWRIYRERFGMNVLQSAWYFTHYVYFYIRKMQQQRKYKI
ncbi:glycosyltransferase family 2 protein [Alkalibacillus haloalkaliphilus]|uniref:N-acetylgalactosaminyl-diphosphoundecaprenol glucuronosyltransferase n=1 Tax=Alkalibacillus haloalkaliphilus TaxID=94136 RepID=A0A511VZG0_9BACI|nr:glycosyltransferase family 2 protein [Alkalibacillus haloalkaliphilus]GEN44234.1 N-acetylgalactosaminyl-diphosphoundecaprenol glucuronosyltransferase [Alkalibacillus haloalkaliphilus]